MTTTRRQVVVTCYGKKRVYPSRKKAMDFFLEGMMWSEGSERERYAYIYAQLSQGEKEVSDEDY